VTKNTANKTGLIIILLWHICWPQIEQTYPPLYLVSIPTAGTLPRGTYTIEALLSKNGGFTPKLSVGFTDNFSFGVSFGVQKLIGNDSLYFNKTTPEVQIKYRVFDESQSMPALVYGLDTQGRGTYTNNVFADSVFSFNRYEQKAWGMYLVLSKNWSFLGNLGLHGGICKSITENDDGDEDLNFFGGIDKELNRAFSFLIDYDAALNDNNYKFNDISFGKGKGYLNAGIRWAVSPNLMMEINFNDISKNTDAEYINREIKIMYSESF